MAHLDDQLLQRALNLCCLVVFLRSIVGVAGDSPEKSPASPRVPIEPRRRRLVRSGPGGLKSLPNHPTAAAAVVIALALIVCLVFFIVFYY